MAKQSAPLTIALERPLPDDAQNTESYRSKDMAGRYFVSILAKTDIAPLKQTKAEIGIDVGIKNATREGEKIENSYPLVKRTCDWLERLCGSNV
ncbi:MAG: hypothetical protein J2P21_07145 [Chloracidobacterium sp.]|nr:hypothetical protein [Chloracidobacterium sp.]